MMNMEQKAHVYRNLRKSTWSVRQAGRVTGHPKMVCIVDAEFRVQPAGRERVLREKRKNVHAYISGTLRSVDVDAVANGDPQKAGMTPVRYNPYQAGAFVNAETGEPIRTAAVALLMPDGKAWAVAPNMGAE